jgi:hypothetical protein
MKKKLLVLAMTALFFPLFFGCDEIELPSDAELALPDATEAVMSLASLNNTKVSLGWEKTIPDEGLSMFFDDGAGGRIAVGTVAKEGTPNLHDPTIPDAALKSAGDVFPDDLSVSAPSVRIFTAQGFHTDNGWFLNYGGNSRTIRFWYADGSVDISGALVTLDSNNDYKIYAYNLKLRKGWNRVIEANENYSGSRKFITGPELTGYYAPYWW